MKLEELFKIAKENEEKLGIKPRKFKHSEDGAIILDPNKKFDREWYEDDEAFDF
jgi:hypothetical protein